VNLMRGDPFELGFGSGETEVPKAVTTVASFMCVWFMTGSVLVF
jgi:hypothetical protein